MFAIMFFAAGLAVAGLVGSRRVERVTAGGGSANRGLADERGITLQTLIVTAVLVLMAVAAGVVIVAITNSSSDDLEESGNDLQERCHSVEIYDPVVASRNEPGSNFNSNGNEFLGSAIGCIPVCVWVNNATPEGMLVASGERNGMLEAGEVMFVRDASEFMVGDQRIANDSGGINGGAIRVYLLFSGSEGNIQVYRPSNNMHWKPNLGPKVARVAVAPNKNECHTYDSSGEVLL